MAKAKRQPQSEGITDLDGHPGTPNADPLSSNDPSLGSAPKPADAEDAVKKSEAEKSKKPEAVATPKPVVPYRVFAVLSGMKIDKLAGFRSHVMREQMMPATVAEWHKRYDAFMAKPVKSLKR